MQIKEAIILAGGLGTRLRETVPDLPKCLAPVAGKPFLHYIIQHFLEQGIERFIFAVGYKQEMIRQYLDLEHPSLRLEWSVESEPLDTGGAIRLACRKALHETALVINGDTLFRVNVNAVAEFHRTHGAECSLCLKPMQQVQRYGIVELNPDASVKWFREKQYYAQGLINGGVYALQVKNFLDLDMPARFSFEKDYLEKNYPTRSILGFVQDEYFIDIGIPEDYARAQIELKNQ